MGEDNRRTDFQTDVQQILTVSKIGLGVSNPNVTRPSVTRNVSKEVYHKFGKVSIYLLIEEKNPSVLILLVVYYEVIK
jgi:hypothetical protein